MEKSEKTDKSKRQSTKSLQAYSTIDTGSISDTGSTYSETDTESKNYGNETENETEPNEDDYPPPNSPRLWAKRAKGRNLLVVSLSSFVVSIAQSIILPSLEVIGKDLGAKPPGVAATMTFPLIVLGIMNMIVSPYSDAYGRKFFHVLGLVIFTIGSIACALSWNIQSLIGFRVVQAFGAAAPSIIGSGVVSDMYDVSQRGQALSLFLLGPLIGPVMGPIFGGLLASANLPGLESWRLIFYVIGGLGGLLTLISMAALRETLIKEKPKKWVNPFAPLAYLKYMRITLLIIMLAISFAGFFAINISFPTILEDVYGKNTIIVGLCYLPFGAGLIVGSVIGGRSADRIRRRGGTAEHRLLPCILFIPLNGIGVIAQGWVFEYAETTNIAVVLVISFFLGLTFILPRPGTNTYAIEKLKLVTGHDLASSATGLIFGIMFPVAAIIAQLSVDGIEVLGYGAYLSIVGGCLALSTLPIAIFVIRDIRQAKLLAAQAPKNTKQEIGYDAIN